MKYRLLLCILLFLPHFIFGQNVNLKVSNQLEHLNHNVVGNIEIGFISYLLVGKDLHIFSLNKEDETVS